VLLQQLAGHVDWVMGAAAGKLVGHRSKRSIARSILRFAARISAWRIAVTSTGIEFKNVVINDDDVGEFRHGDLLRKLGALARLVRTQITSDRFLR
jgi:hypothetical protein